MREDNKRNDAELRKKKNISKISNHQDIKTEI